MSAAPFQTRMLETATTFTNETDGEWHMADWDRDGIPDLVLIKTSNTPSGKVEVHIASGKSNFQTRILETATTFGNEADGTWLMADSDGDGLPDLIFVKTANTPSGHVEIHIASGKSNFQTRTVETATTFSNETDGTWMVTDWNHDGSADLALIKTANTLSGKVEVHIASAKSNYQTRIVETATTFGCESDGVWLLTDADGDKKPDLVFIKTANTPGNLVEVHIASAASNFQTRELEVQTTFGCETDGSWRMVSWKNNGVRDLVFIKTSNTLSGTVEVHIAAGWYAPLITVEIATAAAAAAIQAAIMANAVSGIRVHCTGAFEMTFSVACTNGTETGRTDQFGVDDNMTISVQLTGLANMNWPQGASIYPVAHIEYGSSSHSAGQNVTFDKNSKMIAVYNCSGGCYTPSFSYQENSSDVGNNAVFGNGDTPDNDGLHDAGGVLSVLDEAGEDE